MATIGLPLTGAGDATAVVAVDLVGGEAYQRMKLHDGEDGSTLPLRVLGTTPGSTAGGMVTRPIASTAYNQAVVGAVGLTSGSSQVGITSGSSEVALTSAGSTRLVGRVTVENPTTAVSLSSQHTVTVGNPTTAVSLSSQHTFTVGNPTTAVTVSSGVILGAGSSANTLGAVAQGAGSTSVAPWYVITTAAAGGGSTSVDLASGGSTKVVGTVNQGSPGGSSADAWWVRTVTTGSAGAGSTTVDANLTSEGSTKVIGIVQGTPFSSANIVRATANSSAEAQLFAANAARDYVMITNMSTAVNLFVGLTTQAVSTLGANAHFVIPPAQTFTLGGQLGNGPKYTGPVRVRLNSTTLVGPVIGVEFTT